MHDCFGRLCTQKMSTSTSCTQLVHCTGQLYIAHPVGAIPKCQLDGNALTSLQSWWLRHTYVMDIHKQLYNYLACIHCVIDTHADTWSLRVIQTTFNSDVIWVAAVVHLSGWTLLTGLQTGESGRTRHVIKPDGLTTTAITTHGTKKWVTVTIHTIMHTSLHVEVIKSCSSSISQLSAHCVRIITTKLFITHCSPLSIAIHLHQTMTGVLSLLKTNLSIIGIIPNPTHVCNTERVYTVIIIC